jgi:hypothetical protein
MSRPRRVVHSTHPPGPISSARSAPQLPSCTTRDARKPRGLPPGCRVLEVAVSAAQAAGCRLRWATAGRAVRFTRFRSAEAGQRSAPAGGAPFATPAGADSRRLGPLPSARATPVETPVPGWGCVDCAPRREGIEVVVATPSVAGPARRAGRPAGAWPPRPGERGHPGRVRVSKSWLITLLATAGASPRVGSTPAQLPPAARRRRTRPPGHRARHRSRPARRGSPGPPAARHPSSPPSSRAVGV